MGARENISCAAINCSNGIDMIKNNSDISNCGDPCNSSYCRIICILELTSNDNGAIIYCQSLASPYEKSEKATLEVQSK